jgi:hypothetical protein
MEIFTQKLSLSSQKYWFGIRDPRSRIRKNPIPVPGSRGQKDTGYRIRNTGAILGIPFMVWGTSVFRRYPSGSCSFFQCDFQDVQKNQFLSPSFFLVSNWRYMCGKSVFKDIKLKFLRRHKTAELRFFLIFFLVDGRICIYSNSYGSGSGQWFQPSAKKYLFL